jgi:PAS domain S-box-containing protein
LLKREGKAEQASTLLAAIVSSSSAAIITKTLEGIVTSWNEAATRLFGYTEAEMTGRSIRRLIPSEKQNEENFILAQIGAGQVVRQYETIRLHKDGRRLHVSIVVSPIRNKSGTIIGASKIVSDISAEKLAEERLRASEARFRATFENAAVGIAHVAAGGSWLLVNRRLCEITGYSREELLAKTFQDITHPDDLEVDLAQMRRMLDGAINDYSLAKRYIRKDGSICWVRPTVGAVRKSDGSIDYFISVVEDIAEQKRAEDALRASEARYRSIISAVTDAIIVIDEAGIIQSMNPAGERILGYRQSELVGKNLSTLMAEPDRSAHGRYLTEYLLTGNAKIIGIGRELKHVRKDGSVFTAELIVTEWRTGGQRYFTGSIRDITERKRHEEQVQLLLREVSHRAKNMLALVQAVARQTVAASADDFMQRFQSRIQAIAASQDLLLRNAWKGADLGALIHSQLAHFKDSIGTRIALRGPPCVITASAAQTLGMALHELATNAGKYGALSTEGGSVEIEWSCRDSAAGEVFAISWRESGGPPVAAPSTSGFGSTVISTMAAWSLDAKVELDFPATGASWRLECPASQVLAK